MMHAELWEKVKQENVETFFKDKVQRALSILQNALNDENLTELDMLGIQTVYENHIRMAVEVLKEEY